MNGQEKYKRAFELWERWFKEDGCPWEHDPFCKYCFFCKSETEHKPDCIFVTIKELVGLPERERYWWLHDNIQQLGIDYAPRLGGGGIGDEGAVV